MSEQILELFRRDQNNFLSQLVTMDKTCLYHYGPEIKQQSMERWHSGSPRPKKFRVQKSAGKVLSSIFFGNKTASASLIIFQRTKTINAECYSSLLVQLKDILKEKCRAREGHQGGLVLTRQCPGIPGTCNPEETGLPGLLMS